MQFPCRGGKTHWELTADQVASWQAAYPALDVARECQRALVWLLANPHRHKTHKGMPRMLVGWLNKEQDKLPQVTRWSITESPLAQEVWCGCPHTPECPSRWICQTKAKIEQAKAVGV